MISTLLIVIGSVIAVSDDFDSNLVGFLCVWAYNLSGSFQKVFLSAKHKETKVTPFEANFFYVCTGFISLTIYNCLITDNYLILFNYYDDPEFQKLAIF